jgi:hypothetical protein
LGAFPSEKMKTKDLILKLQELIDAHEPCEWLMGEHEIVIDQFSKLSNGNFEYKGFSPDIKIERSQDNVYDILSGFLE